MPLLSDRAAAAVAPSAGGYLSPSKVPSGSAVRFSLLTDVPLEYYEVWGVDPQGKSKPFRFMQDPSPDDLAAELGEYSRRLNYDGSAPEPVKFSISLPVYNYDSKAVEVLSLSQKSLIRELDAISQMPDYDDITACDFALAKEGSGKDTRYKLLPLPRRKGADAEIAEAWAAAQDAGFDLGRLMVGGNPFAAEKA